MVILSISPPVDRPELFIQDISQVSALGEVYSPGLGLQYIQPDEWVPTSGQENFPSSDPQDPQPFQGLRAPGQFCFLLAGFSRAGCFVRGRS
jgi:hypothetical protein